MGKKSENMDSKSNWENDSDLKQLLKRYYQNWLIKILKYALDRQFASYIFNFLYQVFGRKEAYLYRNSSILLFIKTTKSVRCKNNEHNQQLYSFSSLIVILNQNLFRKKYRWSVECHAIIWWSCPLHLLFNNTKCIISMKNVNSKFILALQNHNTI